MRDPNDPKPEPVEGEGDGGGAGMTSRELHDWLKAYNGGRCSPGCGFCGDAALAATLRAWTPETLERVAVALELAEALDDGMLLAEERARTRGLTWYKGVFISWCPGAGAHLPHYVYMVQRPGGEMLNRDGALGWLLDSEIMRVQAVSAERAAPLPAVRPGGTTGWAGAA